jgi:hypothetical protein
MSADRRIGGVGLAMSFLTEYLADHPDRLPDRRTLRATLSEARDYGHASLVLSLLAEHDRRERPQVAAAA